MNEMTEEVMQTVFKMFAEDEGSKDGKLSCESIKKLLKEVGIINKNSGITESDVDAAYTKICKDEKGLGFADHKEFFKALAEEKKVEPKELIEKVVAAVEQEASQAERPEDRKLSNESVKTLLKEVGIINKNSGVTEDDVDAAYTKTFKDEKGLGFADDKEFIKDLAEEKKVKPKELIENVAAAVEQEASQAESPEDGKLSHESVETLLKEVGVIGKDTGITEAELDAAFAKIGKKQKGIAFTDLKELIKALAEVKKVEPKEIVIIIAEAVEQEAQGSKASKIKFSSKYVKTLLKEVGAMGKDAGITEADVDAAFAKICKEENGLKLAGHKELIKAFAEKKKVETKELIKRVAEAVEQEIAGAGAKHDGNEKEK